jgi:hypothetical protein
MSKRGAEILIVLLIVPFLAIGCGAEKEPPPPVPTATAPPMAPAREGEAQELPPDHPPPPGMGASMDLPPVPEGAGTGRAALAWKTPEGWVSERPASAMRRAQYKVPGPDGEGECVVFYFGPGQGGDPMSNAARWASQFEQPDGRPSDEAMKTSRIQVGSSDVLLVEVTGTYDGGMTMSMQPAKQLTDYMLLGAVAEGPDANWFFKFTGPRATVEANRDKFDAMVRSLERGA